ncbi:hypothetical protein HD553DRAFT_324563 [Filobasidium floriforme]|uniref:uncharacterized protein n=1 Tax=Filobasidium floriforme TaxID=5210 RepID=UPI001E8D7516|nr:uncharacterized protein HD553DRAFT_324563 [Filobasidium floriforme]KAH8083685.1 hypothetical protein HD553DRAFT_324563 [Filobasidium floriforme]
MTLPSLDLKRRSIQPWRSRPFQARQAPSGHRDVRPAMRVCPDAETKDHPVFGRNSLIDFAILGDRVPLCDGSSRGPPAHLIAAILIGIVSRLAQCFGQTPVMVVLETTLTILLGPGKRRETGRGKARETGTGLGRLRILGTSPQSAPHLKIFIEMMPGAGLHRASALPMDPRSERSGLFPDAVFLDPGRGGYCDILGL